MRKAYKRLSRQAQLVVEALDLVDLLEQARRDAGTMIEVFGCDEFRPHYERLTRLAQRASLRADRRIAKAGKMNGAV